MLRRTPLAAAYTRWKCDRSPVFAVKFHVQDVAFTSFLYGTICFIVWRHFTFPAGADDMERRDMYYSGYPWGRDPIARRNEDKNKRLIRDNNIDILDAKWTGVDKATLQ